jgi:hypothetical protein
VVGAGVTPVGAGSAHPDPFETSDAGLFEVLGAPLSERPILDLQVPDGVPGRRDKNIGARHASCVVAWIKWSTSTCNILEKVSMGEAE